MGRYALQGAPQALPRTAPTAPALYSVPRPSGGYDYYRAPIGSAPPQNDDFPVPTVPHANDVGVSSLTVGRPLPPGCVHIGSGDEARGSITPLPGVIADGPLATGLGSDGLGALSFENVTTGQKALAVAAATALVAAAVVYRGRRLPWDAIT